MIRIPASPENPSFNLAQAVLLIAYELFSTGSTGSPLPAMITTEELTRLFQRLRKIMEMAGYAPKGIRDAEEEIMADLKRLIARAAITAREARMLHGIISRIEESLGRKAGKMS
jgi:tRNA/rRNA methyltransferase